MENEEEITAVVVAALMAYSSDKKIYIKKVKKVDESCKFSGWLMHNPQTFWRTRKE